MARMDGFEQSRKLFQQALELSPPERQRFLAQQCEDPGLREEVASLLRAHDGAGEEPAPFSSSGETQGDRIDRYKLLERIGEGGFGTVWMAEQLEPVRRKVALKIIKLGMDTRRVIARFEAERQALAMMDHPNIARVLDGGATPSGRPFFVMELVRGVPVTEFCDERQLGAGERLELFMQVCHAVHHAHQKGIVHRDIKPSNILVTLHEGSPVPKVIDFGIAKATSAELTQRTMFTGFRQMLGTPEYMAPEQAEMSGLDIDTRADIYSLGVVLYELLTGTKPFERILAKGLAEMLRVIREEEPDKPSTRVSTIGRQSRQVASLGHTDPARLGRLLRGDLDWIVMKALEKDRSRRYESAAAFAGDVRRHLDDEPVVASPPSRTYKLRKYVRRHRGTVVAVGSLFAALVAGVVSTAIQARIARADRNLARDAQEAATESARLANERADVIDRQNAALAKQAYALNVQLAFQAVEDRLLGEAHLRLAACPEELRGWEWNHIRLLTDGSLSVLDTPPRGLGSLAFSPDGRLMAVGCGRVVQVYDVATRELLGELGGHEGGDQFVIQLAFDSSGTRLATGGHDGFRLWDVVTRACVDKDLLGEIKSIDFTPDGRIAYATDSLVKVKNSATGEIVAEHSGREPSFGPDGTLAFIGSPQQVVLIGKDGSSSLEHSDPVFTLRLSPDGSRLATVTRSRSGEYRERFALVVWDLDTGTKTRHETQAGHIWKIRFSNRGNRLATFHADGGIRIWDPSGGKLATFGIEAKLAAEVETGTYHTGGEYIGIEFVANDTRIIRSSPVKNWLSEILQAWDVVSGEPTGPLLGHEQPIHALAASLDGSRLATRDGNGSVRIWDANSGSADTPIEVPHNVDGLGFSQDGARFFASVGNEATRRHTSLETASEAAVLAIDAHSGAIIRSVRAPKSEDFRARPDRDLRLWGYSAFAFSPDGSRIATISEQATERDPVLELWAVDSEVQLGAANLGHLAASDIANALALERFSFSGDGSFVVCGLSDGSVRWFDGSTATALAMQRIHEAEVLALAIAPDGSRVVSGAADGTLAIFDGSGEAVLATPEAHDGPVRVVAFSPDGSMVVSGSDDHTLQLFDTAKGRRLRVLEGHTGPIFTARFSPDGRTLASSAWDRTARLWSASTGELLHTLRGHDGGVTALAFHPDGSRVATASVDGTVRLWDVESGDNVLTMSDGEDQVWTLAFSPDGRQLVSGGQAARLRRRFVDRELAEAASRQRARDLRQAKLRADAWEVLSGLPTSYLSQGEVIAALYEDGSLDDEVRDLAASYAEGLYIGSETHHAFFLARRYAFEGDADKAFEWLFHSLNGGVDSFTSATRSDRGLRGLRQDPRFAEFYRQLLSMRRDRLLAGHEEVGEGLGELGEILVEQRSFREAEGFLREALEMLDRVPGRESQCARFRSALGAALAGQATKDSDFEEAEKLLLQAYYDIESSVAYDRTMARQRVVDLYVRWGKQEQAEAWRTRAEEDALFAEAYTLLRSRQYEEAESAYARLTEVVPESTLAWFRLGEVLAQQGKYPEAIHAWSGASGRPGAWRALAAYRVAIRHAQVGDKDQAMDWLSLAVEEGYHAEGDLIEDSDLAGLQDDPRLVDLAYVLVDKTRAACPEERWPAKRYRLSRALIVLGSLLEQHGRYTEAEKALRECLAIRERICQPNFYSLYTTKARLGAVLARKATGDDEFAEAEALLREAFQDIDPTPGAPIQRDEFRKDLVALYERWGKQAEAARWRDEESDGQFVEAKERFRTSQWTWAEVAYRELGERFPQSGLARYYLGRSLLGLARERHASEPLPPDLESEGISILESVLDTPSGWKAEAAWRLAVVHATAGDRDRALEWLRRAAQAGWGLVDVVETEGTLDPLREDPRYAEVLALMKQHKKR